MTTVLRVAGWSKHFENNRTRELRQMAWVPVPNRLDSDGYATLIEGENGPAHFGAWIVLLEVASRCTPRGTLLRDGRNGSRVPHDVASLGRLTRFPAQMLAGAIERLVEIGWLEVICLETGELERAPQGAATIPHLAAESPQDDASSRARENGTERKERRERREDSLERPALAAAPPPPAVLEFPCTGAVGASWGLTEAKLDEYRESFPGLDVLAEMRNARQWLLDNPTRRKTFRGMPSFLGAWLRKEIRFERRAVAAAGPAASGRGALFASGAKRETEEDRELEHVDVG